MKARHLLRLAIATILGSAATLQAATFVQFQAGTNQFAGAYQSAPTDYSDSKTRTWDLDTVSPLYTSAPPIYGGMNVVNSGTSEGGSYARFHDNSPVSWPNVPEVFLYSVATATTVNNVNMCYLWKRSDFVGITQTNSAAFDSSSVLSVNLTSFGQQPGYNTEQIRFLVQNGSTYYVSEAVKTSGTGTLSLSNFNNNSTAGYRWAPITLSGTSFDIPASLTFAAQAFTDVQSVGWIGRGSAGNANMFAFNSFSATGIYGAMGMAVSQNLDALTYFSSAHPFVDAFKLMSTRWTTHQVASGGPFDTGYGASVPMDANGWPTQVPFTPVGTSTSQMVTNLCFVEVPGIYRLRFSGTGTFSLAVSGSTSWSKKFFAADCAALQTGTDGKYYYDMPSALVLGMSGYGTPNGQVTLQIFESSGANYLRGFELVTPGCTALDYQTNHPFYPPYLSMLAGARTFRLMDWGATNANPLVNWTDRPLPSSRSVSGFTMNGVAIGSPIEWMVKICNEAGTNLWFNIPAHASMTYIQNAAKVIHYGSRADGTPCTSATDPLRVYPGLNPGLKVYIEYSNETWNPGFEQYTYCITSATTLRAQGMPFSTLDGTAGQQYTSYQSANIWQAFYQEWGTSASSSIVRVLGSQMAASIATNRLRAFGIPNLITVPQYPDVVAVAPYIGGSVGNALVTSGSLAGITPAQIIALVNADMVNNVIPNLISIKAVADQYGVYLNAYEGGQHLVGTGSNASNDTLTTDLINANRDPGMGPLYTSYLSLLANMGLVEFTNFKDVGNYSNSGSWGGIQYLGDPAGYKYQAVKTWMQNYPASFIPPRLTVTGSTAVLDADGNGSQSVTISGSNSFDYDGVINSYNWLLSGTNYSGSQISKVLPLGTSTIIATTTNGDGLSTTGSINVMVRPQGSDTLIVQSNFTGTAPGVNKPWTSTSTLSPNLTMGGWTWTQVATAPAYVFGGSFVNDAFTVQISSSGSTATTFDMALSGSQCLSCTVTPVTGHNMDLRGGYLEWTLNCTDSTSAKECALMTSAGGFTAGSQLYTSGTLFVPAATTMGVYLPYTSAYSNITGPFEIRIYFFDNAGSRKQMQLTTFKLTGKVN